MSAATAEADELWSAVGDPTRRRVLDLLLERGEATATTVAVEVTLLLVVCPGQVLEAGLDDGQPRCFAFRADAELDERRVGIDELEVLLDDPAEREEVRWLDSLDLPVDRAVPVPAQDHAAARPQVELGYVAEPAADVLGLGHYRPHDLHGRVDQDRALDALRDYSGPP